MHLKAKAWERRKPNYCRTNWSIQNSYIYISIFLLFAGCASKEINLPSQDIVLTIKTKKIKFNDIAIIKKSDNKINININLLYSEKQ